MPDFTCDVGVISAFTSRGVFQIFTLHERDIQNLCFNMFILLLMTKVIISIRVSIIKGHKYILKNL